MNRDSEIDKALKIVAQLSIDKASRSLSKMVKAGAKIELERAEVIDIAEATAQVNTENCEVMGAFIDLEGDAPFKFLFYTDALNSLKLAELILRKERESMKDFEVYARSAVQEIANLLASAVANVFSMDLAIRMDPTPPLSVHDFVGTIFTEYIADSAAERSSILMIESKFSITQHDISCQMFILPVEGSEKIVADAFNAL